MPVEGIVSSAHGMRTHPVSQEKAFHHGVDIRTHQGTPVYPMAEGRVSYVGSSDSYGNFVEVMHEGGIATRYAHLHSSLVEQGDVVDTSRPFAFVGNAGGSTASHLHFEVMRDGKSVDPREFINGT